MIWLNRECVKRVEEGSHTAVDDDELDARFHKALIPSLKKADLLER
jgi:hypothetical protein